MICFIIYHLSLPNPRQLSEIKVMVAVQRRLLEMINTTYKSKKAFDKDDIIKQFFMNQQVVA
jgi:hypothetical protein